MTSLVTFCITTIPYLFELKRPGRLYTIFGNFWKDAYSRFTLIKCSQFSAHIFNNLILHPQNKAERTLFYFITSVYDFLGEDNYKIYLLEEFEIFKIFKLLDLDVMLHDPTSCKLFLIIVYK